MSSWLEGEERELWSERTRVQFPMAAADQLKGEIEGRADCKVREGLEEEETSFLPLIGITFQINQKTNHHLK